MSVGGGVDRHDDRGILGRRRDPPTSRRTAVTRQMRLSGNGRRVATELSRRGVGLAGTIRTDRRDAESVPAARACRGPDLLETIRMFPISGRGRSHRIVRPITVTVPLRWSTDVGLGDVGLDAPIRHEPHERDDDVDRVGEPPMQERQRNRDDVEQRREPAFRVVPDRRRKH